MSYLRTTSSAIEKESSMRMHCFLILLASLSFVSTSTAQQNCRAPEACVPRCDAPRQTAVPPATPRVVPQQGYFARSQASGEFAGESNAIGIRGLEFRLPEIRLSLPEIRIPSVVHYRRNPEMIVDRSRAPWLDGQALELNPVGPARARAAEPPATTRGTPSCNGYSYEPSKMPAAVSQLQDEIQQQQLIIAELQKSLMDAREVMSRSLAEREKDLRLARLANQLNQVETTSKLKSPRTTAPQIEYLPDLEPSSPTTPNKIVQTQHQVPTQREPLDTTVQVDTQPPLNSLGFKNRLRTLFRLPAK